LFKKKRSESMKSQLSILLHASVRLSLGLLLLVGLCLALGVQTRLAHAATNTVTDCTGENGPGQIGTVLRSASPGDTITFSCSGSGNIPLTSTLTISTNNLIIDGGGTVTLDGQNQVEVLSVTSGVTLTLNALTVANGNSASYYGNGGGIFNSGTLSLSNSTLSGNSATFGGGINNDGTVSISNSTLSGNSAPYGGGGIYNDNSGTVSLSNSTLSGNSASNGDAGGIDNYVGGTVTISNSTLSGNSTSGVGGGIENYTGGTVSISNSTLSGNSAAGYGGIYNSGAVTISNSTLSGNSAPNGYYGGIFNGGTMTSSSSIVADNPGGDCLQSGTVHDQGYNLESGTSCGFTGPGSLQNANPHLLALANNGGPTQTMALQQGSPAIDVIPTSSGLCPATDQRGVTRPDNGETNCDMGAYESNYPPDSDLGLTNLPSNITTNATSPQGAVVTYTPPTVVDEDNPLPPVTCSPASGSTFAIGTTTVTCTVSDSDDTNSPVSQSFSVTVQPVLTVNGATVNATEGSVFSGVVATGTAYGTTNPLTASINWGDGNSSTGSVTLNPDGSYSVAGSHTYAEEGSFTSTVTVKDSGSLSATGSGSAQVADAALTLTHFVAGSVRHLYAGLGATFTDADPNGQVSDYAASINWGDGHTTSVNVVKNPLGKGFVLAGLHQYARKGTYTITLTVSDSGGSQATQTVTITVR
jgi:hypothetical protein